MSAAAPAMAAAIQSQLPLLTPAAKSASRPKTGTATARRWLPVSDMDSGCGTGSVDAIRRSSRGHDQGGRHIRNSACWCDALAPVVTTGNTAGLVAAERRTLPAMSFSEVPATSRAA